MPVPSTECGSCYPAVWCVWAFDLVICFPLRILLGVCYFCYFTIHIFLYSLSGKFWAWFLSTIDWLIYV